MNAPFQSIAGSGATPVGEPKSPAGSRPLLEPSRIPVSGANAADCEKAIETMRTTFQLVRSLVRDTLENLNENLPVTSTVNYEDQMNLLYDMEGDLVGKLANAAEAIS